MTADDRVESRMRAYLLPLSIGLGGAILGTLLVLASWHVYLDHQTWHILLNNLAQQQAQSKK